MRLVQNSDRTLSLEWTNMAEQDRIQFVPKKLPNSPTTWRFLDILQDDLIKYHRTEIQGWKCPQDRWREVERIKNEVAKEYPFARDYQCWTVANCLYYNHYCGFIDMGLGKSLTIILTMREMVRRGIGSRFLLVCLKTLFTNWEVEFEKWSNGEINYLSADEAAIENRGLRIAAAGVLKNICVITNYETFRVDKPVVEALENASFQWDAIFCDESSRLRNDTKFWKGLFKLRLKFKRRYVWTGYPAPYAPSDYVNQLGFLSPMYLGYLTKKAFEKDIKAKDKTQERQLGRKIDPQNERRESIVWLHRRVRDVGIVLHKDDSGVDLPDKIYVEVPIRMTGEQADAYHELENQMELYIEKLGTKDEGMISFERMMNGLMDESEAEAFVRKMQMKNVLEEEEDNPPEDAVVLAQMILVAITRLSQITGGFVGGLRDTENFELLEGVGVKEFNPNPKLNALIANIEENRLPIVVSAHYKWEIERIIEECRKIPRRPEYEGGPIPPGGLRVEGIYGTTDTNDIIRRWHDKKVDVIVVNPQKGGMGLNLQASDNIHFYSNSYRPEDREQMENRVHRLGQDSSRVTIFDYTARGTIDSKILTTLKARKTIALSILLKERAKA